MIGGNNRDRTYDPLLVRQMLSQLSYAPMLYCVCLFIGGAFTVYKILSIMSIRFLKKINIHLLSLKAAVYPYSSPDSDCPGVVINTIQNGLLQTMVYLVSLCCIV